MQSQFDAFDKAIEHVKNLELDEAEGVAGLGNLHGLVVGSCWYCAKYNE